MLQEHAKILRAIQCSGEIVGRKKLQKMIYIAKKLHFPFEEKFEFHFYGPYSEELTLQLEELINMGFITEIKENKGNYFQYRYRLTETGEEFVREFARDVENPVLNDVIKNMNEKTPRFLELVSTVLYFEKLPKDQLVNKIFQVKSKQRYTEEEIDDALKYIAILRKKTEKIAN